jgi:dipeptidyl aminopeptidase/acylaminoacyl peptidase
MANAALAGLCAALTMGALLAGAAPIAPPPRIEHGNLVLDGVPAPDAPLSERLDAYLQYRQATFLDWLPEGGMLIATRFAEAEQIHRVATPLGAREQITFLHEPVRSARVPQNANAEGFVFLTDHGGDENAQLYFQSLHGSSAKLLTDGKSLHGSVVWSHDGKRIAFHSNQRDGVNFDVYVTEPAATSPPRLVVASDGIAWYPLDWSLDDSKLLLWNYVSINESYLFVADVASGALTPIDARAEKLKSGKPAADKVGVYTAKFAPDGRGVYVVSDEGSEFAQLRYVDLTTHASRVLTERIPWDIESFDVSADGRYIAYAANEDGVSHLTVLDLVQKLDLAPPGLPSGLIRSLRFDLPGKRLALSIESPQSPRDVYVYDLERNALVRWTHSELGPVDATKFVPAELAHFSTWDRVGGRARQLPLFVYRPATPGRHPVLIHIHGGPEAQARPDFDTFRQFLVNELNYVVIEPNVRGSSGYGKTFLKLDNGLLREDAVRDIGSLLVWIGLQSDLDPAHIVVSGASYGGFMSLASLAAYSDRLRGGIDMFGISNFVTFLANTSAYRRDLRRAEYGDERDPKMREFLVRLSPLTNAAEIRRPVLIVQGLNDPRVPASESQQMVWKIRSAGGEAWYLSAKDEGHGFRKKANRDFYLQAAATFLQKLAQ